MRASLATGGGRRELDGGRDAEADRSPSERAGRVAAVAFAVLLFFPIRDLVEGHPTRAHLALVLAGVAGFVAVYLWRFVFATSAARPTRSTWVWLGVACTLVGALVVGDSAQRWAPLFIFLSAVIAVRIGLPWGAYGVAACTVLSAAVVVPAGSVGNALAVAVQALAIGALLLGMGRLRITIAELQDARERLALMAVTEERLRFARDLHDLLGHSLSVIALKAELAGRLLPAEADRAAREVADIDAVARRALADVREAVSGYRQPTLADAIATGRMALDAAGIEVACDIAQVALPPDVDIVLGWAVREAVTNVVRHSGARHCWIRVTASLVEAAAEITDDGVDQPGAALAAGAGNGLAGLAERVAAQRGRLEAGPGPDGGFRVRASVPTAASLSGVAG